MYSYALKVHRHPEDRRPVSTVIISAHGVHRLYRKREKFISYVRGKTFIVVYIFLGVQLSGTAYGGLVKGRLSASTKPLTL